jgi:hypothetical protein
MSAATVVLLLLVGVVVKIIDVVEMRSVVPSIGVVCKGVQSTRIHAAATANRCRTTPIVECWIFFFDGKKN